MELAPEDNLRINVLFTQNLRAVRIDDSKLTVHALTSRGEAKIRLNPNLREEKYLRGVRELFSTFALGSPGGYPVFIRRWTRMGQDRDEESLRKLLLLGEDEAIVAVANAPGLTDELAELAWWASPTPEIARLMLSQSRVSQGAMGPVLAQYLLEYLPFEAEHKDMIESVRLMLQPGLLSAQQRDSLWQRAQRRPTYYIGFLHAVPDALPDALPAHSDWIDLRARLAAPIDAGNPFARKLDQALSPSGQTFMHVAQRALSKIANQDAAVELLDAIGNHFRHGADATDRDTTIVTILARAGQALATPTDPNLAAVVASVPEQYERLRALLALGLLNEYTIAPILGHTDAIGSVMRTRLEPVIAPVRDWFATLGPPSGKR